jgi:hypothetical protein
MIFALPVALFALSVSSPSVAQDYSGFYDGRVDGRPSHDVGLPPSAADKGNGRFDNPISPGDCAEADMLRPDARPDWQARVRAACGED